MINNLRGKESNWIRLDEEKNAIDYLEKANYFIHNLSSNIVDWKWVIICLHGALYSFAIAACKGTDSRSVIEIQKRNKKETEILISIWKALGKCRDFGYMKKIAGAKCLVYTDQQEKSIELLISHFRNEFEHFKPKGWSIEINMLPRIAIDALYAIKFLALEANGSVLMDIEDRMHVKQLIEDSIHNLNQ
jgi:hypothetical protein